MNERTHRLGTGLLTVLVLLSVVSVAASVTARTTSEGCILRVWDDERGVDEQVCADGVAVIDCSDWGSGPIPDNCEISV